MNDFDHLMNNMFPGAQQQQESDEAEAYDNQSTSNLSWNKPSADYFDSKDDSLDPYYDSSIDNESVVAPPPSIPPRVNTQPTMRRLTTAVPLAVTEMASVRRPDGISFRCTLVVNHSAIMIGGQEVNGEPSHSGTYYYRFTSVSKVVQIATVEEPTKLYVAYVNYQNQPVIHRLEDYMVLFVSNDSFACNQLINVIDVGFSRVRHTKGLEQSVQPFLYLTLTPSDYQTLELNKDHCFVVYVTRMPAQEAQRKQIRNEYNHLGKNRLFVLLTNRFSLVGTVKASLNLFGEADPESSFMIGDNHKKVQLPTGHYVCEQLDDGTQRREVCASTESHILSAITKYLNRLEVQRADVSSTTKMAGIAGLIGLGFAAGSYFQKKGMKEEIDRRVQRGTESVVSILLNLFFQPSSYVASAKRAFNHMRR